MAAPLVFDGPINTQVFEAYVEQFLAPTLRPGDIVIMDNLSSHKGPKVRDLIEAAGASLRTCRPTVPTSTRSKRPSPSSSRSCERPPSEPLKVYGRPSVNASTSSRQPNAETISPPPDTMQSDGKPL